MAGRVWPQHYFSLQQNASMLSREQSIPTYRVPVRFNPMIGIVIAMLFVCCFLLGWLTFYLRACLNARFRRRHGAALPALFMGSAPPPRQQDRGLDPDSILALPIVQFSSSLKQVQEEQGQEPIVECSVCLTEFEDKETLKLLPGCGHVFHVGCIDKWLFSHSTCPLCRSILVPPKFPCCCNHQAHQADPAGTNNLENQVSIVVSSGDTPAEEDQGRGPTGEIDSPSKLGGLYRSQSTPVPRQLLEVNQNHSDSSEPGGCLSRTRSWAIL